MPELERALDSGDINLGALVTDRAPRYGWDDLVQAFGAVKVRATISPGEGRRRWDEAVWKVSRGSGASGLSLRRPELPGGLPGRPQGPRRRLDLAVLRPVSRDRESAPGAVVAYALVFLRFHSDRSSDLWSRYLSRSVSLDRGPRGRSRDQRQPELRRLGVFRGRASRQADHLQGRSRMGAPAIGRSVELRRPDAATMKLARALLILVPVRLPGERLAGAQVAPAPPSSPGTTAPGQGAGPLTALVDQLLDLFPKVAGEVDRGAGRHGDPRHGTEGRRSSRTRARDLSRGPRDQAPADRRAPRAHSRSLSDASGSRRSRKAFSQATTTAAAVKPGDRFRASSGKVQRRPAAAPRRRPRERGRSRDTGAGRAARRDRAVPRVHGRSHQRRTSSQEGIKAEDFLQGKGVQQAAQRFKVENLLAVYFKRVQGKPYMEVRFYALPRPDPAISTALLRAAVHPVGRGTAGRPILGWRWAGESARGQAAVAPGPAARR